MLVIEALDGGTVECAGALVAREQAAARQVRPELPAAFDSPGAGDLETIARLALVELQHRSVPPMFAPRQDRPLADLVAEHRTLREAGAVHLLATLDGYDVGLLTIELTSPVPRLCPDGQPYIGPTATLPGARGQGVGHALVDTALTWAHDHGYQWVSVDFDTANPLSRPFWLHAGFRPAGYGVLRLIDGRPTGQPGSAGGQPGTSTAGP